MAGIFPSLQRTYLVLYNWTLFLGGSQVLNIAATALITTSHLSLYVAVENPLLLAQSATLSEILHSLTGIVRSPVAATLSETHFLVGSLVVSWSIVEIIRYSVFWFKEAFVHAPPGLVWLRYNTFLMLYPLVIGSEVGLIWCALQYMRSTVKYSVRMPNRYNC
ncbi:Very-long-chain (3R)-3-hydroxyacyl-CoA dehydratase PASTICCINO 2 [Striga hermonthica]|uniref:Very-long-chain (3R)-3-hydroxyacyl-CoA dehydratase n=1 Tax=Striga hermonthica TaxID=68872 RepID=A0A9N7MYH9_STRHE|nr:Very-long-chain (3R)-3-hydroxyacyl-CoA dehydratase PASTICCINO 2 [Striga hermonthica]